MAKIEFHPILIFGQKQRKQIDILKKVTFVSYAIINASKVKANITKSKLYFTNKTKLFVFYANFQLANRLNAKLSYLRSIFMNGKNHTYD